MMQKKQSKLTIDPYPIILNQLNKMTKVNKNKIQTFL